MLTSCDLIWSVSMMISNPTRMVLYHTWTSKNTLRTIRKNLEKTHGILLCYQHIGTLVTLDFYFRTFDWITFWLTSSDTTHTWAALSIKLLLQLERKKDAFELNVTQKLHNNFVGKGYLITCGNFNIFGIFCKRSIERSMTQFSFLQLLGTRLLFTKDCSYND